MSNKWFFLFPSKKYNLQFYLWDFKNWEDFGYIHGIHQLEFDNADFKPLQSYSYKSYRTLRICTVSKFATNLK